MGNHIERIKTFIETDVIGTSEPYNIYLIGEEKSGKYTLFKSLEMPPLITCTNRIFLNFETAQSIFIAKTIRWEKIKDNEFEDQFEKEKEEKERKQIAIKATLTQLKQADGFIVIKSIEQNDIYNNDTQDTFIEDTIVAANHTIPLMVLNNHHEPTYKWNFEDASTISPNDSHLKSIDYFKDSKNYMEYHINAKTGAGLYGAFDNYLKWVSMEKENMD
mmetsp:Transcript_3986/g.5882  ORF Transcript_3986/g.5882 Transcript_3986/m.5882 type:complete len:218 (+) Transcript_3986:74-727(+)|eukprot:CAMPEP_0117427734 /NCGR_PEP_ID=MMETSP0758-20121206/7541_1 /TAXON_ID=63605 /ORGANISM="Percolomonas cosmopolitus, Strain AE-1 (ATCC 50343)" /LENGTH=217 /DNA_ID=CAMNT_0005213585 /DNA_START=35 /DNA_END=688 /DNA_ORIENTATION=+